jgi:VWFA-related protein
MRRTLAIAALAVAMQQTPPAHPPVFRAGTHLVQVNIVVHDKQGQPVADLKQDDFTLLERGKPQTISFFSIDGTAATRDTPPAPLPSRTFTNAIKARADAPTSVTVILLDTLNSPIGEQMRAREGLLKFLGQIQAQDRIAIFVMTEHGLALLHDYTTDAAALVERLRKASPQASTALAVSDAVSGLQQDLHSMGLDVLADADQVTADLLTEDRIKSSLAALQAVANHLAGLPGRKNLVWLSSGFPLSIGFDDVPTPQSSSSSSTSPTRNVQVFTSQFEGVVRDLNNAGIAIYPIDARGVFNPAMRDTAQMGIPKWNGMPNISAQNQNTSTMFILAERTGGRVAYSTNDIGGALRRALDDGRVTYTLGYYPADAAEDGKWRDIKVKVNRAGLDVRSRTGYFAMRPADQAPAARAQQLRAAVWSPVESTALPFTARVTLPPEPADTIEVDVELDADSVSFKHEGDRWKARLDMVFVQKDAHGVQLGEGGMDALAIALTDENYRKVVAQGLVHRYRGPRRPTAATLRIVVRDATTGTTGSVTVPFAQIQP